ncbi:hypothetical protein F5Y15DRAFT_426701 [Xylariaceae sp. FL0016]|nr:hypothetical protein F5Y15DRAFT_426701 [Xylariaceae sp. FL0016]
MSCAALACVAAASVAATSYYNSSVAAASAAATTTCSYCISSDRGVMADHSGDTPNPSPIWLSHASRECQCMRCKKKREEDHTRATIHYTYRVRRDELEANYIWSLKHLQLHDHAAKEEKPELRKAEENERLYRYYVGKVREEYDEMLRKAPTLEPIATWKKPRRLKVTDVACEPGLHPFAGQRLFARVWRKMREMTGSDRAVYHKGCVLTEVMENNDQGSSSSPLP